MAVTQHFTVEIPHSYDAPGDAAAWSVTMTREDAESLYSDLGEALGVSSVQGPQEGVQDLLAAFLERVGVDSEAVFEPQEQAGRTMTPDEALARAQAQAQVQPAVPVRNPGTGIGNG